MSLLNNKNADIQTYGELEKYLYGGYDAFSYFNRATQKCMPLTQIPVDITKCNGTPNFGYTWSVVIDNNDGDYLTNSWLTIELPKIELKKDNLYGENGYLHWNENFMHNVIDELTLSFNEIIISKLDCHSLDLLSEYNIDENKYGGYMRAIGNVPGVVYPSKTLESKKLFLPLPLFFCNDTGNAIPLAALPNTEIRINIRFKSWENLLILEDSSSINPMPTIPVVGRDIEIIPQFKSANIYGTFVTVTDEERLKLQLMNRTIVINQLQTCPRQMVAKDKDARISLFFKQSVTSILFAAKNGTFKNVASNYNYNHDRFTGGIFVKNTAHEIIKSASISYNGKNRVIDMPAEFFSFVNPWYHCKRTPTKSGLYVYNFGLGMDSVDPCGGVSLSKIDNPVLTVTLTDESLKTTDNFELIVVAMSNNVIKISEGLVSFAVL